MTGSDCRCCVKYVALEKGILLAVTLCRNGGCEGQEKTHPIEHNTDFSKLFHKPELTWFFGNDLPDLAKSGGYQNTTANWKTRYRSTLVWPIGRERPENAEAPDLLGFLCVDSKRERPFSDENDYVLGAVVADVLYPFVMKFSDSLKGTPLPPKDVTASKVTVASREASQSDEKVPVRPKGKKAEL